MTNSLILESRYLGVFTVPRIILCPQWQINVYTCQMIKSSEVYKVNVKHCFLEIWDVVSNEFPELEIRELVTLFMQQTLETGVNTCGSDPNHKCHGHSHGEGHSCHGHH